MIQISLSGPPGSGKSSVMKKLIDVLGAQTADVGQIFRQRAVDAGMTIDEYDRYIEQHPEDDIQMEKDFCAMLSEATDPVVVSWRLAFLFEEELPNLVTIWLDVSENEGARRIYRDDRGNQEKKYLSASDAKETNARRMIGFRNRFEKIYHVDFTDLTHYDIVIDTTEMNQDEVVEEVIEQLRAKGLVE